MSKQLGQEANCRQRFLEVLRSLLQLLREELQWIQKSSGGAFPKPRNGGLEMSVWTCTTTTTTTTTTTNQHTNKPTDQLTHQPTQQ